MNKPNKKNAPKLCSTKTSKSKLARKILIPHVKRVTTNFKCIQWCAFLNEDKPIKTKLKEKNIKSPAKSGWWNKNTDTK